MWTLVICAGISAMGCGVMHTAPFPSQDECERALSAVVFHAPKNGDNGRSGFAYCRRGELK